MSLEEEALQFGNPALWSSREGIWRRRGQEVLLEGFQSNYQRERQKCWSLFPLEPFPGLGRAIPPSTSSTSPTLSTFYSSRRPAWDGDGGSNELLLLIILSISSSSWSLSSLPLNKRLLFTLPPHQPDMEMEVALELLPMIAKRSLLHNSQAASLEILEHFIF